MHARNHAGGALCVSLRVFCGDVVGRCCQAVCDMCGGCEFDRRDRTWLVTHALTDPHFRAATLPWFRLRVALRALASVFAKATPQSNAETRLRLSFSPRQAGYLPLNLSLAEALCMPMPGS